MQTNHFSYGGEKKKLLQLHYNFFQKSFTAIKENTLKKKFYCPYATLWGQFKKKPVSFFFPACNSREQITAVVFYYFNYLL